MKNFLPWMRLLSIFLMVFAIMLLAHRVFAQDVAPVGAIVIDNPVASAISAVADKIPLANSTSGVGVMLLFVSEVVMRAMPSKNPLSWLYAVIAVLKSVMLILNKIVSWCDVLLQNVKPPSQ